VIGLANERHVRGAGQLEGGKQPPKPASENHNFGF
jgi:hypothetical protein